jgi:hypothetical protein
VRSKTGKSLGQNEARESPAAGSGGGQCSDSIESFELRAEGDQDSGEAEDQTRLGVRTVEVGKLSLALSLT